MVILTFNQQDDSDRPGFIVRYSFQSQFYFQLVSNDNLIQHLEIPKWLWFYIPKMYSDDHSIVLSL
ncbi:hypothetical protein ED562_05180 [Microcystis aeruginosa FACHB-524]|nr:hypothetical protein ED562_05180 [Microcystis aeruginosa FACHB-524]